MQSVNRVRRLWVIPACAGLLLALAGPLGAQVGAGKLTGTVMDRATGQPLAGVQVYLEGTGIGALTRENGRYFLLNVPPGTYSVAAELIGYATLRKENVLLSVDVTRIVNFELPSQAVAVEELVVEVETVPLIEIGTTGAGDVITAGEIEALPVAEIPEVLALQHGFLQLPENTDVITYLDTRRGVTPLRIRGGRSGETLTLVDGIPINNFLLGGPAFYLSSVVVEQLGYARGGFEAKYGNALSGVINLKTREPRDYLQGLLSYQTSELGGALGSNYEDLLDYDQVEGYVSGPIPGTAEKLRFVLAGRDWNQADRVLQFDDDVMNPVELTRDPKGNFGSIRDLIPGWRGIGFDDRRDIFGKLVYYFTPTAKLSLSAIDYQRQTKPYDFRWLQVSFDLFGQCVALYPDLADVCSRTYLGGVQPEKMEDLRRTGQEEQWMAQNTIEQRRQLWVANWDHTFGRIAYQIAGGRFESERDTCVFLSGLCLSSRIASNWRNGPFERSGEDKNFGKHPIFGTDDFFGGDRTRSWFFRTDGQWQATDHHNLGAGVFYQKHKVRFEEGVDVGLNAVQIEFNRYAGTPWDAAVYFQDNIEYDFVTLRLGFRLDYGRASGLFFADPRDPTNGTTAFEVCQEPESFGFPGDQFRFTDPSTGETFTGITACAKDADLLDLAVDRALEDDFLEAKSRSQFSPRIGISFPVTANSALFFNYGRFSQNPVIHSMYRQTAIGFCNLPSGDVGPCTGDGFRPGTGETAIAGSRDALKLVVNSIRLSLVGNPHLVTEATSSYELGYSTDIGDNYGFQTILFSKDQFGLTGLREGGLDQSGTRVFDAGSTYGSTTFDYNVLLNLDYQTARGIELSLRRRLADFWAFDVRYAYQRIRTNAAPPELELEKREENDQPSREEIRSEIDQPHTFNGVFRFVVGDEAPDIPLGSLLRNSTLSFILRAASGLPFTPTLDFDGDERLERNSGTSPMTFRVDMLAKKDFRFRGLNYGVFVRVTNLLNRDNCLQVFSSTGRCDSGDITEDRLRRGGVSHNFTISQSWDRPDYLFAPRWVSAGARVSF